MHLVTTITRNEFTDSYPGVFDGRKINIVAGARRDIVVIRAVNRFDEKQQVEAALLAHNVQYQAQIEPSISPNIETLVVTHLDKVQKVAFKPLGGSAGVGAQLTAVQEQAIAIYLAAGAAKEPLDYPNVLKKYAQVNKFYRIRDNGKSVLQKLPRDWQLTAERISKTVNQYFQGKQYVYHWQTPLVKRIEATWKKCNDKLPKENKFRDLNKWNPADVWAVEGGFNPVLSTIKSMEELNGYLRELLLSGKMVGISLKSAGLNVRAKLVNVDQRDSVARSAYHFDSATMNLPSAKNLLTSKGSNIYVSKNGKKKHFSIRDHRVLQQFNAELVGGRANHGKMSYGAMATLFEQVAGIKLPPLLEVKKRAMDHDSELISEIFRIASKYDRVGMDFDSFVDAVIRDKGPPWIFARYLGAVIIEALHEMPQHKRDQIAEGLMSYASSQSELSGPFLKVS